MHTVTITNPNGTTTKIEFPTTHKASNIFAYLEGLTKNGISFIHSYTNGQ